MHKASNSQDSRVTGRITPSDFLQLEKLAHQHRNGGSFWVKIISALRQPDPDLELHRCSCGQLILANKKLIDESKEQFAKSAAHDFACWHLYGLTKFTFLLDQDARKQLNAVIDYQRIEDHKKAQQVAIGLIPPSNGIDFIYSVFRLTLALNAASYRSGTRRVKNKDHYFHSLMEIDRLFKKAESVSPQEYKLLLASYSKKQLRISLMASVSSAEGLREEASQVLNEEARLLLLHGTTRGAYPLKNHQTFLLEAYKSYFEITQIYELIYSLLILSKGGSFQEHPFNNQKVTDDNGVLKKVDDKKRYMLLKIIQDIPSSDVANRQLRFLLERAYDNKLRNETVGHNSYFIDQDKKRVFTLNKTKSYSFEYIHDSLRRLKGIIDACVGLLQIKTLLPEILSKPATFMGIGFDASDSDVALAKIRPNFVLFQFWCLAEVDDERGSFTILKVKLSKDCRLLFITPSETFPNNPLRVEIGQDVVSWLESLLDLKEVIFQRYVIAPKFECFQKMAIKEVEIKHDNYFVIGVTQHKISVNTSSVKLVLKILKEKEVPPMPDPKKFDELVINVQNYHSYSDLT